VIAAELGAVPEDVATIDTKVALIQALIPVELLHVAESLQQELEVLTGPRYARPGGQPGLVRYGRQAGSVYLADQKLPIQVPRVRDRERNREVALATYQRLQTPRGADAGVLRRLLAGLSCRDYAQCAEAVPEAFGLSASTVSRRYIKASTAKLAELRERRLEGYDLVALFLDGKTFAADTMVIALGVTVSGAKVVLGFVQMATENAKVCTAFLRGLGERGLQAGDGLLVVMDGGKGLHAAVETVLGSAAVIQRCDDLTGRLARRTIPRRSPQGRLPPRSAPDGRARRSGVGAFSILGRGSAIHTARPPIALRVGGLCLCPRESIRIIAPALRFARARLPRTDHRAAQSAPRILSEPLHR
jgi:hypothetical protein